MNWETILCAGDSITIGSRSYLGYPEYAAKFLAEKTNKNWNAINYAFAGYTTIDLARSIDKNFADIKVIKPEIATILVGTNDLKSNTSPDIFRIAYQQLVLKIQLIIGNNNIILIEIPELMNGVMLPYKINMNQTIIEYNKIINSISNKSELISTKMECEEKYFYDGVHLNESGSENFGRQISECILKMRKA